jgi:hypothetical protein
MPNIEISKMAQLQHYQWIINLNLYEKRAGLRGNLGLQKAVVFAVSAAGTKV